MQKLVTKILRVKGLNDNLMGGPTLQNDLFHILINLPTSHCFMQRYYKNVPTNIH
jgi:hypothetical protein